MPLRRRPRGARVWGQVGAQEEEDGRPEQPREGQAQAAAHGGAVWPGGRRTLPLGTWSRIVWLAILQHCGTPVQGQQGLRWLVFVSTRAAPPAHPCAMHATPEPLATSFAAGQEAAGTQQDEEDWKKLQGPPAKQLSKRALASAVAMLTSHEVGTAAAALGDCMHRYICPDRCRQAAGD